MDFFLLVLSVLSMDVKLRNTPGDVKKTRQKPVDKEEEMWSVLKLYWKPPGVSLVRADSIWPIKPETSSSLKWLRTSLHIKKAVMSVQICCASTKPKRTIDHSFLVVFSVTYVLICVWKERPWLKLIKSIYMLMCIHLFSICLYAW